MQIYTVKMSSTADSAAFNEFVGLLGMSVTETSWVNKWHSAQDIVTPFEEIVGCDRESPYLFGRQLRKAVSFPEPENYPYPAVTKLNGVYYCQGDEGLFSFCLSTELDTEKRAADLMAYAAKGAAVC